VIRGDDPVQASVVLFLLGRDRAYPRTDLLAALPGVSRDEVRAALASLSEAGVIQISERGVRATRALRRLDELGLIVV
jgi:Mn-dependent DtxR family transcriptional regulator